MAKQRGRYRAFDTPDSPPSKGGFRQLLIAPAVSVLDGLLEQKAG